MIEPVALNLRFMARELDLPQETLEIILEFLNQGQPAPYIARYQRDKIGNIEEEKIRNVINVLQKQKLFIDRKQTILKTIDSQEKLTPELDQKIREARSSRRLDDLYLPFRSKKNSYAADARKKGMEPLAQSILNATEPGDLNALAAASLNEENGVSTPEEALKLAGQIISEILGEQIELRQRIREMFQRNGKIVSRRRMRPEQTATEQTATEQTVTELQADDQTVTPESVVKDTVDSMELKSNTAVPETVSPDGGSAVTVDTPTPIQESSVVTEDPEIVSTQNAEQAEETARQEANPEETQIDKPESVVTNESHTTETTAEIAQKKVHKSKKSGQQSHEEQLEKQFGAYFDFSLDVRNCPAHRVLALNRGEKQRVLQVRIEIDRNRAIEIAQEILLKETHPYHDFLVPCVENAVDQVILPVLEREARQTLTEHAEQQTITGITRNLKNFLLQRPLNRRRVLAIEPGFKNGCKVVALDEFGNILVRETIFVNGSIERKNRTAAKLTELVEKFNLSIFAIGNGIGSREVENFIVQLISTNFADKDVAYITVNDAGARAYAVSPSAKEEFPDYDPAFRSTISIGRRLQNPLNELVKIEPGSLGARMAPQEIKQNQLKDAITDVIATCVNKVGVNPNSASAAILRYVSGLNPLTARRIADYRMEHGPFRKREDLRKIPGINEHVYRYAIGFLCIPDGYEPLDRTKIHPEQYDAARAILAKCEMTPEDLLKENQTAEFLNKIAPIDKHALADELSLGINMTSFLIEELSNIGHDVREKLPAPIFKKGVMKIEDLSVGMELTGTVLNVVDFGAFVDIGLHESGLVHISQMGCNFVRDAHQYLSIGDILKVWVLNLDVEHHRISLTLLPPGTEKERHHRGKRNESARPGDSPAENQERSRQNTQNRAHLAKRSEKHTESRESQRENRRDDSSRENATRSRNPRVIVAPPKKKKLVPLSPEMKSGKEPLRSFSDLAQLLGRVQVNEEETKE